MHIPEISLKQITPVKILTLAFKRSQDANNVNHFNKQRYYFGALLQQSIQGFRHLAASCHIYKKVEPPKFYVKARKQLKRKQRLCCMYKMKNGDGAKQTGQFVIFLEAYFSCGECDISDMLSPFP